VRAYARITEIDDWHDRWHAKILTVPILRPVQSLFARVDQL
jgi:hypothetical protein